jgi:hypothetical protein
MHALLMILNTALTLNSGILAETLLGTCSSTIMNESNNPYKYKISII